VPDADDGVGEVRLAGLGLDAMIAAEDVENLRRP
jgi:hypothetical protein